MIRHKLINATAAALLDEAGVVSAPVDVKALAQLKGAIVVEEPLDQGDFSGFLYTKNGSPPIIGVNSGHAPTRKRFTIAHELGHLLLHPKVGIHMDEAVIQRRDAMTSEGTNSEEIEANRFAAELLMPQHFLRIDLAKVEKFHADDEEVIADLARRYGVSGQAMAIRLNSLGIVTI